MDDHSQPDLEAFIHEELRRLPELSPPGILTQRVRQAILEAELERTRPWWRRAWWSWPTPLKATSAVAFVLLGILVCLIPWALGGVVDTALARVEQVLSPVMNLLGTVGSLLGALELLGRSLARSPWAMVAAGASLGAYFLLVGVGTFYVRFAVNHCRPGGRDD